MNEEPEPLARYKTGVSDELQRIVDKPLRRDVNTRYQSAADLKGLLMEPTTATAIRPGKKSFKRQHLVLAGVGLLLVFAIYTTFSLIRFAGDTGADNAALHFQEMQIKRLSTSSNVWEAAISGDGKYLVQEIREGNKSSLWLRQVETNSNVQILAPDEVSYGGLRFSPDGNHIYYRKQGQKVSARTFYKIPILGGNSKQIISDVFPAIKFSQDGSHITFIRRHRARDVYELVIASPDGANEQIVMTSQEKIANPAWSPKGETIACYQFIHQPRYQLSVMTVNISGGQMEILTSTDWDWVQGLEWLPNGGGLVAAAKQIGSAELQLWHISYPSGKFSA